MASDINPESINENYPVAGVPNNTQGFRDNFSATKTNFDFAKNEINELQSKAVLKSALTGQALDNNMLDNLLYAARIQDFSGTIVEIPNTSGSISIDYSAAHFQTLGPTTGSISIGFTNWPANGFVGVIRLQITVNNTAHTLTLPAAVTGGTTGIQGYLNNVITFGVVGTYEFSFLSYDGGENITIFDLNRPLGAYTATTPSTSTTTGALTVAGGVGIAGNVHVGGSITGNISIININTSGTVTAQGGFIGDLRGSVAADDSTLMIDGTENQVICNSLRLAGSEDLGDGDPASLDVTASYFSTSPTAETATLAAGSEGLVKTFIAVNVAAGNMVITVTNPGWSGSGTMTFSAQAQACTLQYVNAKWYCIGNNGVTFG
jgi:hypothetical protein